MNVPFRPPPTPHKFTLDEARRLWASGALHAPVRVRLSTLDLPS